jgi:hypothetical protein
MAAILALPALLARFFGALLELSRELLRLEREAGQQPPCLQVPPPVQRKPDPCLYSQFYLLSHFPGLPVTWDNPDITLTELDGTLVPSTDVAAGRDYLVNARIWDASFAPALATRVQCWYRSFGISAPALTPVEVEPAGEPRSILLNIGAWGNETAQFHWRTPDSPGHYCLVVACFHPDDAEPGNNVGQKNLLIHNAATAVTGAAPVVDALITNPDASQPATVVFHADSYEIPDQTVILRLETADVPLVRPSNGQGDENAFSAFAQRLAGTASAFGRPPLTYSRYAYKGAEEVVGREQRNPTSLLPGTRITVDGLPLAEGVRLGPGESRILRLGIEIPPSLPGNRLTVNVTAVTAQTGSILGGVTIRIRAGAVEAPANSRGSSVGESPTPPG